MIGFAGLSHLGIVSALAAAAKGFSVVAYHPDSNQIERLRAGALEFNEPRAAELLLSLRQRITFSAESADLGDCELVFVSLDVETDDQDQCQLDDFDRLIAEVSGEISEQTPLVILSQVPPGTTRRAYTGMSAQLGTGAPAIFCQVETLILGKAVQRALEPERIIVGCANSDAHLPTAFARFLSAFDCPILKMRFESAELAKIAINTYLAASVSVTNTLSELCETVGGDWSEIVPALQLDERIGRHAYLTPGLGIGGGNLERDLVTVQQLAEREGTQHGLVDACLASSRSRQSWALRTLHLRVLSQYPEPKVGVWGLAYKPNTSSTKNSPALEFIRSLQPIPVVAYDPEAMIANDDLDHCQQVDTPLDACLDVDVLAVLTPWPVFKSVELDLIRRSMRGRAIIDPYGLLSDSCSADLGFDYFRLGSRPIVKKVPDAKAQLF